MTNPFASLARHTSTPAAAQPAPAAEVATQPQQTVAPDVSAPTETVAQQTAPAMSRTQGQPDDNQFVLDPISGQAAELLTLANNGLTDASAQQTGAQMPVETITENAPIVQDTQQVEVTLEDAPAEAPGVTMHMITGHQNSQIAAVMSGTLGQLQDDQFTIDPIYGQVAYLFTLSNNGIKDAGTQLTAVNLPNEVAAKEFMINMIALSSKNWDALYDRMATGAAQGDVMKNMVNAEKTNVANAVARVIQTAGLTSYDVPVTYEVYVGEQDEINEDTTAIQLIQMGNVATTTIERKKNEPAVPTPAQYDDVALDDATCNHDGSFLLEVTGAGRILASSPENAQAIFAEVSRVYRITNMRNMLTVAPKNIDNCSLNPREVNDDFDEFEDRNYERGN